MRTAAGYGLCQVDIDRVAEGMMVYDSKGMLLGVVRGYLQMNGNYAARKRRHLAVWK